MTDRITCQRCRESRLAIEYHNNPTTRRRHDNCRICVAEARRVRNRAAGLRHVVQRSRPEEPPRTPRPIKCKVCYDTPHMVRCKQCFACGLKYAAEKTEPTLYKAGQLANAPDAWGWLI
jgi:hypothetical protein